MIDKTKLDELRASGLWGLRTSDNGIGYFGYVHAPVGEWGECPRWTDEATCDGGGFFMQGPEALGFQHEGSRLELVETGPERKVVDSDKIAARRMRILYTNQDALDALVYLTGGLWAGSLCVPGDMTASALAKVGGSLYVRQGATLNAQALAKVGGSLELYEGATLNAPALAEAGGSLYARDGATLNAPALAKVGTWLYVRDSATLNSPLLGCVGAA